MLEGYRRFLAATAPARDAAPTSRRAPSAHDTHPPLAVRLGALRMTADARRESAGCAHLLDGLDGVERHLLASLLTNAGAIASLTPVSWDEWGRQILPAIWTRLMESRLPELRGVPLPNLPSLLDAEAVWWRRLSSGINIYSPQARRRQLCTWLGHWAALSLIEAGFVVTSAPGAEAALERGAVRVEPFRWVEDLASGARTPEQWRSQCQDWAA
jgi:hypothetical protein